MEQLNNVVVTVFLIAVLATAGTDATIDGWSAPSVGGNTVMTVPSTGGADTTATVMLRDTAKSGYTVTTATATSSLTAGGTITYTIEDSTDTFGVIKERTTYYNPGDVYLHCSPLDDSTSYTVTIKASDGTGTGTGTLTLKILVNFSPVITGGRICSCDIATGTVIGKTLKDFDVTDRNDGDGDTATYDMMYGDWDVEKSTGALHVRTGFTLDRTRYRCYYLTVTATDNGGRSGTGNGAKSSVTAELSVYVNDVGTETRCSCSDGAAAVVGSVVLLLAAGISQLM